MKAGFALLMVAAIMLFVFAPAHAGEGSGVDTAPVVFADPEFERMLRDAMEQPDGPIFVEELAAYDVLCIDGLYMSFSVVDRVWLTSEYQDDRETGKLNRYRTWSILRTWNSWPYVASTYRIYPLLTICLDSNTCG